MNKDFLHSPEPWAYIPGDDEFPPGIVVINPDRASDAEQFICEFPSTAYARRIPADVEVITAVQFYAWAKEDPATRRKLPGPVWYEIPQGTFEVGSLVPVAESDDPAAPRDGFYLYLKNDDSKYSNTGIHIEDEVALYSCPRPVKNADILGFNGDANANAERVALCVNLCSGLTDDELRRMMRPTLKDLLDELHAVLARVSNDNELIHDRLEKVTSRMHYVLTGEAG